MVTPLFIGVGNGLEVPPAQPVVVTALVANGVGELSGVHPAVDVHVHTELLRSVTKDQGQHATQTVGFTVAHDEFSFVVANGAVGS